MTTITNNDLSIITVGTKTTVRLVRHFGEPMLKATIDNSRTRYAVVSYRMEPHRVNDFTYVPFVELERRTDNLEKALHSHASNLVDDGVMGCRTVVIDTQTSTVIA